MYYLSNFVFFLTLFSEPIQAISDTMWFDIKEILYTSSLFLLLHVIFIPVIRF